MNLTQAVKILRFAATLDKRMELDATSAETWHSVLDPDMDADWASGYINRFYANGDQFLIPSKLNTAWRNAKSDKTARVYVNTERHCLKAGCTCKHEVCYMGWIDMENNTHATRACPTCKAELIEKWVQEGRWKEQPLLEPDTRQLPFKD